MKRHQPHIWTHTPFPKHGTSTTPLFTFFISTHTASQDIFLPLNGFQRTSAFHSSTSWDFHLAKLITLSSSLHYHILPHSNKKKEEEKKPCALVLGLWFSSCIRSHLNEPVSSQLRKLQLPLTWPQVPHVYPVLGGKSKWAARASVSKITLQNVSEGQDGTCGDADEQQFN